MKTCSGQAHRGSRQNPPPVKSGTEAVLRQRLPVACQSDQTSEPRISAPSPRTVSGLSIVTDSR